MASRSSNRAEVPEAKEALDRFKMEVAGELGVPLSDGYNGNLTLSLIHIYETAKERYGEIADFMKLGGETLDEKVALLIA